MIVLYEMPDRIVGQHELHLDYVERCYDVAVHSDDASERTEATLMAYEYLAYAAALRAEWDDAA